ncbi:MAG: hypothetical protein U0790_19825 [Isosphaeraceae bacterium]
MSCRQLRVDPLDPGEARELAVALLDEDDPLQMPPEPPLVEGVVRESAGNPFFLVELVRHLKADARRARQWLDADRPAGHAPGDAPGPAGGRSRSPRCSWSGSGTSRPRPAGSWS